MYSVNEVESQILELEKVAVSVNAPSEARFKVAYNEFFKESLGGEATAAELKLRVETYLNTQVAAKEDIVQWVADMDFNALLEHSYAKEVRNAAEHRNDHNYSRLEFLSEHIFNFTTYEAAMDEFFTTKALEVCWAITEKKTFDYIHVSTENRRWYLAMCNMPFFSKRINWGTSIRGAWWDMYYEENKKFETCGLWVRDDQLLKMTFDKVEVWIRFIRAVMLFGRPELAHG